MTFRKPILFAAICLLAPVMFADSLTVGSPVTGITLTISDYSLTSLGYKQVTAYIDPYKGTLDGSSVLLFCVDPDHFDGSGPYSVDVSTGVTGWGSTEQVIYHSDSPTQAGTLYGEEAYLSQLLVNTPVSQTTQRQEIQGAIWQLADPSVIFPGTSPGDAFNLAVGSYESGAKTNGLTSGFEILTDSSCTIQSGCTKTRQEYLVLTPEPGSLTMLGLGLITVFRRRAFKVFKAG